ncbi:hypothetical protein Zm00014a_037393 [Zea mays]|uniref:Uncharacterized protein n=1 Tax=Zea mays TaxID=4577 RepID=A0A317YII0_MAIZE|nr:hypothetical protein Zm00014a_037393 [Zea mays]
MERRSSSGAGSCLGLLAVAVVSTSVILVSYRLHRRLEADLRVMILGEGDGAADQGRRRTKKNKKVRFAADVAEPSSSREEYRRRRASTAAAATRAR